MWPDRGGPASLTTSADEYRRGARPRIQMRDPGRIVGDADGLGLADCKKSDGRFSSQSVLLAWWSWTDQAGDGVHGWDKFGRWSSTVRTFLVSKETTVAGWS
jgi:hypothetical protein